MRTDLRAKNIPSLFWVWQPFHKDWNVKKKTTKKRWKIQSHLLMSPADILISFFFWVFLWTRNRTQDWERRHNWISVVISGEGVWERCWFSYEHRWLGWRVWRKEGTGVVCGSGLMAQSSGQNWRRTQVIMRSWILHVSKHEARWEWGCTPWLLLHWSEERTHADTCTCRTTWQWVIRTPGQISCG